MNAPRREARGAPPEPPENDWNTDALTGLIAPKEPAKRSPPPSSKPMPSSKPLPETRVKYLPPAALTAPASSVPLGGPPVSNVAEPAAAPAPPSGVRRVINVLGAVLGAGACLIVAKNALVARAPAGAVAAASAIASASPSAIASGEATGKRPKGRAPIETRAVPNPTAKDAANAFARGDYLEALAQYRALGRLDSGQVAYPSLIRVLERRLAAKATPE